MSDKYSPQLAKGHTRIANEWLEAMLASNYPASLMRLVAAVVRETWGWQKTWREVPVSRFCFLLKIKSTRFYQLRDEALKHNLIEVRKSPDGNSPPSYRVQKMYVEWCEYRPSTEAAERGNALRDVLERGVEDVLETPPVVRTGGSPISKEICKENSKESAPALPSDKERRLRKREALLVEQEALVADVPQGQRELIEGFIENCAAENGTGTVTLSREVSTTRELLALRDEVGGDAWAYGMFQANGKRATAINYVKKAAGSFRPGSSNGGLSVESPLLKMRGPARAEAFERTKPLEPPSF